ncbi:mxaD protein [Methylomarinovum tepidoasis]|uniref:MxaD protein n=2 Tax=Methylomarinovum tepidoasis TaxID=2840183 RepID=A0AAU9CX39_9GAMM|nr:mxaD protein [Methylomarinovum sp. IN45]
MKPSIRTLFWILAGICLLAGQAQAHGPTPQKSDAAITMKAPLKKVWQAIKEPTAICRWHPSIDRCDYDADKQERVFYLQSGERFSEAILEVNEANHTVYLRQGEANVKALPVSSYSTRIQVEDNGDGTVTVRWRGRYYRGDTGNFPPQHLNDEAAVKAMNAWIEKGLKGLKNAVES